MSSFLLRNVSGWLLMSKCLLSHKKKPLMNMGKNRDIYKRLLHFYKD